METRRRGCERPTMKADQKDTDSDSQIENRAWIPSDLVIEPNGVVLKLAQKDTDSDFQIENRAWIPSDLVIEPNSVA